MNNTKSLSQLLGIKEGITALVGGGGKTSTIYWLVRELTGQGKKVLVTTTTKIFPPKLGQVDRLLINPKCEEVEKAFLEADSLAIGSGIEKGKLQDLISDELDRYRDLADYVLVEADGAKHLPIKVPAQHEPVLPNRAEQVLILVGLACLGRPIKDVCFRSGIASKLLGVDENKMLGFKDIFRIIESPYGLSKGIEKGDRLVILNQSDLLSIEELDRLRNYVKDQVELTVILASLNDKRFEKIC
ncbi:MAG: putative selenium-dependent hydroxylase accessory protein YqeC [Synergistaceae bacterium]|nr:putative selenium-dependent hydroxylase accessory protein YqeC [Synergistaceae bacterium]